MRITLYDVAERAGVSPKTVSRVINNEKRVSVDTRQRVLRAAEELGFTPNLWAQKLARGRSATLGLFFFGATPPYLMMVINCLLNVAEQHDYQLSLFRVDIRDQRQVDYTLKRITTLLVDGVILTAPCGDSPQLNDSLAEMGIPLVCLSPRFRCDEYPWVAATDHQGSYEATKHLITLGHTRIGNAVGHPDHQAATDRFNGYRDALLEANLELDEALVQQGDWSFESGRRCALTLLELKHPPSAIVAGDDEMAAGVLRAAQEKGVSCPQQLSVVGFDDIPMASQISPALTTVRQPIQEIAHLAAETLVDRIENKTEAQWGVMLPTELVIRDSTAAHSG